MSPKPNLPSVLLHRPGLPKSSDFIALDCPQFGNKIGDSCPALPSVAQPIVTELVTQFTFRSDRFTCRLACMEASFSSKDALRVNWHSMGGSHAVTSARALLSRAPRGAISQTHTAIGAGMIYWTSEYIYAGFEMGQ